MKTTANLNLKIPEGGDPIDILDITDNFETLDEEISKKSNSIGGDVSETVVKTLETINTPFPIPIAGESTKVFLGKVKKFIQDSHEAVSQLIHVTEVTLTAAGWTSSAPYTQTVNVSGMVETDRPTVSLYLSDGITAADVDLQSKAYDCVNRAVSGNGSIAVYCYKKKPAVDFQIQMKGV
ncbi:hypothetical protein [Clostridium sp. E02]|uniref:hypothetical protein n=1 Tax=Clostridium sp. E02 TaxID=2487134 RepID=UPI000F53863C|nr:hypothetical protein [Clostridium sp. E02]